MKNTDIDNIKLSLSYIANFIKNHPFKNNREDNIPCLEDFGQTTYTLVSTIFESSWDTIKIGENNKTFQIKITENFVQTSLTNKPNNKKNKPVTLNSVDFSNLLSSPPVLSRPSKKELVKLKFYSKNNKPLQNQGVTRPNCSYTQASAGNTKDIFKLKENFPKLWDKKIKSIKKTINNTNKPKPHISITTKSTLCKQVIVSMSSNKIKKFIECSDNYIANNRLLKSIKLDTYVNYIHNNHQGLITITNKVSS